MYVIMNVALGNYQVDSTNQYLCGYEPISSLQSQLGLSNTQADA